MANENTWNANVIRFILANRDFDIQEVHQLASVHSMLFERDIYMAITTLIKERNWDALKAINPAMEGFREFLNVITFTDQNHISYAATVYDSDELWQDPEIVDIFLL